MAITIISSPKFDTEENEVFVRPLHQRWIYLASSDNTGEDGFRYKLTLTAPAAGINEVFSIPPDPDGILIFDAYETLRNLHRFGDNPETIHFATDEFEETQIGQVTVSIIETYFVDGEYTEFPSTEQTIEGPFCFWGAYDGATGPYPPSTTFAMQAVTGLPSRALSDRKPRTHVWEMAATYGLDPAECIFIPSRERDYGVLTAITDLVTTATRLVYKITDAEGTVHTQNIDLAGHVLSHIPVYPANINAGALGITDKPSDYSGWKYYTVQFVDPSEARGPVSAKYVFFPEEQNCDYENIRVAWRTHRGGWDYFNFKMRNFFERNVARNRFERGYSKANFTGQSRRAFERYPTVDRLLNVSSGFVKQHEREFLQWLIQSTEVRIIRDNGTSIPVLVETNNITNIARAESNPLEQMSVQFKYAGDDLNWNGWWVDESEAPETNPFVTKFTVDYGDNALISYKINLATNTGIGSTRLITPVDEYVAASNTSINTDYSLSDTSSGVAIIQLVDESILPTKIVYFGMDANIIGGGLNYISMNQFSSNLSVIDIRNFSTFTTMPTIPSGVDNLVVSSCSLTIAQVNKILTTLDANGIENGIVDISGQTPLASPSGAGITAKNNLIAKGWTVITD